MNLISWARRRFGLTDHDALRGWGGASWSGKTVTPEGAMNLSAWYRCVKLHGDVTGGLPLKFYEIKDDGSRERVRSHPVADLIADSPNSDQTPLEFWSGYAAQLAANGNAYGEKRFVGNKLVSVEPMPEDTAPYRKPNGDLFYIFHDRGKREELPQERVFHTKAFSMGRADLGVSALTVARQTLGIAMASEQAAGSTFAQGLRLSGFFTGPGLLKQDQRDQFTKTFIDPILGNDAKAHFGILESGYDFKPINIPPKDAEMLLSRRFNVEEIARFMGTPPIMIGHSADGQTMWGTGVEAIINMWLTLGYDMFLRNIELSIKKRLMKPEDRKRFYPEFDRRALFRADSAGRSELYWKMIQIAAITPNQVCDAENQPRFEGGDVRLINSTLQPLERAMNPPEPKPAPAAVLPSPEPDPEK